MDYKNTLNLPQTDFPMKADLITRDPERLKAGDDASLPVPPPSQYRSTSNPGLEVLRYWDGGLEFGHFLLDSRPWMT
ncbi:MAG TPA: hypothetical protein PKI20_15995 [Verrucomicrobiota bacterium]|nr:hypothetical protein [Verrucomicrobiota bacterium]